LSVIVYGSCYHNQRKEKRDNKRHLRHKGLGHVLNSIDSPLNGLKIKLPAESI